MENTRPFPRLLAALLLTVPVVANAQDPCDDVVVTSVSYNAFSDTLLRVELMNNGDFFFNYPMLSLLDAQGATVARGVSMFFGMNNGPHTDMVDLEPGTDMPSSPFSGSVMLYWAMDPEPENECLLDLDNITLCPAEPCIPLMVRVSNFAVEQVDASFTWYITDSDNTVVQDGGLFLSANGSGTAMQNTCLPPGDYVLHLAQPFSSPGTFHFSASLNDVWETSATIPFVPNNDPSITTDLPFTFYPLCVEEGNSIAEPVAELIDLALDGRSLTVRSRSGDALGGIAIFDATGRSIHTQHALGNTTTIDLSQHASGVHILRAGTGTFVSARRFILP